MLIVKADAYGHGSLRVAQYCCDAVDYFGVAEIAEGIELRRAGIMTPILVLGSPLCAAEKAAEYGLSLSVSNLETAFELEKTAKCCGKIKVHLAINTGMNRFGFDDIEQVEKAMLPHLLVEGIYSHFSRSDLPRLKEQNAVFSQFKQHFKSLPLLWHISASGALGGDYDYDMVRAGICAYGLYNGLYKAMSVAAKIVETRFVKKGQYVGYGDKFCADKDMEVAVISGGYADGIDRCFSKGFVCINGVLCKIVGQICMDCFFADITNVCAKRGDLAIIMDYDKLDISTLSDSKGTIPYEIFTGFSGRVSKVYLK